jgi:UDP-N-acetylglucosamine:LPS N-acetylglucosamine transferase
MKICLAACAGGHLTQLLRLHETFEEYPHFLLTSLPIAAADADSDSSIRTYVVGEATRKQPLHLLWIALRVARVVLRERPSAVLSTGAAPGWLACFFGKLLGARVIWVDSIANTEKLSLSGRLVRPFADLVLSQWPEVAQQNSGVEYHGAVL